MYLLTIISLPGAKQKNACISADVLLITDRSELFCNNKLFGADNPRTSDHISRSGMERNKVHPGSLFI